MAMTGEIVLPIGVDQRQRRRQLDAGLMVIEGDHLEIAPPCLLESLETRCAAVKSDQQRGATGCQLADGARIGTVAVDKTVGDIDRGIEALAAHIANEDGNRGGAVDVVVAEDGKLFAALDGVGDAAGGRVHIGEQRRIGQQRPDLRVEIGFRRFGRHVAGGKQPRHHVRQADLLRDLAGERATTHIQPVAPGTVCGGTRHAKDSASPFRKGRRNGFGRRSHRFSIEQAMRRRKAAEVSGNRLVRCSGVPPQS